MGTKARLLTFPESTLARRSETALGQEAMIISFLENAAEALFNQCSIGISDNPTDISGPHLFYAIIAIAWLNLLTKRLGRFDENSLTISLTISAIQKAAKPGLSQRRSAINHISAKRIRRRRPPHG